MRLAAARRSRVLAAWISAATLAACVAGPSDWAGDGAQSPSPTVTVAPGQQEDGTMTAEEFAADLGGAVAVAEDYWAARFEASGRPFVPIRRVVAYEREGEVTCGGEEVPGSNAAYCPLGDFIAYDVDWAVGAFRQIGDAFLFYLLGHEYAHGVQQRLGIVHAYPVRQELQADCMAGAYMGDSVRAGALRLDTGDLEELRRGLIAVGDDPGQPWFAPQAHGTAQQRVAAFFDGYEGSLDACQLA